MTTPETSHDKIRVKIASLLRNKLFHPEKDNAQLARLSEEFADLWPSWVGRGEIEPGVNEWLRKLNLSHIILAWPWKRLAALLCNKCDAKTA